MQVLFLTTLHGTKELSIMTTYNDICVSFLNFFVQHEAFSTNCKKYHRITVFLTLQTKHSMQYKNKK